MTSHDVVAIVRRTLHERDIGHLGTLDPAATGLLVLAVGKKALKVVHLFSDLKKEYEAGILFGKVSTTYDSEGIIEFFDIPMGWQAPEQAVIQRELADRFTGKIAQVPPAYSAISVGGVRAYRKARAGLPVDLPPREVEIDKIKVLAYAFPTLRLNIACGSGTYIRSLAHDLGRVLHCGAYLTDLRRTKVGDWPLEGAKAPDAVAWTDVMPLKDVLKDWPRRDLTDADYEDIRCGRNIEAEVEPMAIGWHADLPVAILIPAPDGTAHAKKVF